MVTFKEPFPRNSEEEMRDDRQYDDDSIYEIDEDNKWVEPEEDDGSGFEEYAEGDSPTFEERMREDKPASPIEEEFRDNNTFDPNTHRDHFNPPNTAIPTSSGEVDIDTMPPRERMSDPRDYSADEKVLVAEAAESRNRLAKARDGLRKVGNGLRSYGEGVARAAEQSPILQGDPFMGRSSSEYAGNSASFGLFGVGGIAGGIAGGMAGGMAYADEDPIFGNMFGGGSPRNVSDELGGTFIDMSSPFGFSGGMNDGMDQGNAAMNPLDIGTYIGGNLGFAQEERGEQMYAGSNLDLVFGAGAFEDGSNERDDYLAYGIATYDPMAAIFGLPTPEPQRRKSAATRRRKSSAQRSVPKKPAKPKAVTKKTTSKKSPAKS